MVLGVIEKIRRILLVSSKPDRFEYTQSAKVSAIGLIIVGALGFVIFLAVQLATNGAGI